MRGGGADWFSWILEQEGKEEGSRLRLGANEVVLGGGKGGTLVVSEPFVLELERALKRVC